MDAFGIIRTFVALHRLQIYASKMETVAGKLTVPAVHFEGETIWGATLMILSEFYDVMDSTSEE